MTDPLARLLREHADSLEVSELPSFEALEVRARRRLRTRNLAGAMLAAAAVAAVATVTALAASGPSASPVGSPPGRAIAVISGQPTEAAAITTASKPTAPTTTAPESTAAIATTADQAAQLSVAQAMSEIGARDPNFAGVGLEQNGPGVIVYRAGGGNTSRYPSSLNGVAVRLQTVPVSQAEATNIIGRILGARSTLAAQGIEVTAAGFNFKKVTVIIAEPENWMLAKIAAAAQVDPEVLSLVNGVVPTPAVLGTTS